MLKLKSIKIKKKVVLMLKVKSIKIKKKTLNGKKGDAGCRKPNSPFSLSSPS